MNAVVPPDMHPAVPGIAAVDERIVAALLEKGRLKDADLARARRLQEEAGDSLLSLLARLGLVSERDHAETCAEVLGLGMINLKQLPDLPPDGLAEVPALSPRFLKQFHVCLLGGDAQRLDLWMADPYDSYAIEAVQLATGSTVRPWVGLRSEIDDLIERWHGQGRSAMGTIVEDADGDSGGTLDAVEHLRDLAS